MNQFRDAVINDNQMIIIKKFDVTVNYLYPLRKIKKYKQQSNKESLNRFLASWLGHAKWADSKNLIKSLEIQKCAEKPKQSTQQQTKKMQT